MSLGPRCFNLLQGLGQNIFKDTQRKQIQLNKILKTQVDPVLSPYKSSVHLAVQECFTSFFMLTSQS